MKNGGQAGLARPGCPRGGEKKKRHSAAAAKKGRPPGTTWGGGKSSAWGCSAPDWRRRGGRGRTGCMSPIPGKKEQSRAAAGTAPGVLPRPEGQRHPTCLQPRWKKERGRAAEETLPGIALSTTKGIVPRSPPLRQEEEAGRARDHLAGSGGPLTEKRNPLVKAGLPGNRAGGKGVKAVEGNRDITKRGEGSQSLAEPKNQGGPPAGSQSRERGSQRPLVR